MSLLLFLFACHRDPPADPIPVASPPAELPELAPTLYTPRAIYERCRDRVEAPEAGGECVTDADCTRAGCASEVCVASARAAEVMTSCEREECFGVLDRCGCVQGSCQWSLKLPDGALKKLPIVPKEQEAK